MDSLIIPQMDLGTDIYDIYQSSNFDYELPNFDTIYIRYYFCLQEAEKEFANLTKKFLDLVTEPITQGDSMDMDLAKQFVPPQNSPIKDEAAVLKYLMETKYSFKKGVTYFHLPTKEVW